ncbi:hypothetical protein XELAEV_18022392mg [Xenopus laevis]|uniref:Uncharacterized protein n=1 Tax=Xenopus laevis TaxID=8355 RepID=A0A974HND1_XENLA|nr:hypothetical protein XELAEV_18022392mg [Xenopus laevis]
MRDIRPFVFEYISTIIYCWLIQDPPILCHHVRSDDVIRAGVVPHWDLKSHVSGNLNDYFINSVGPHPPLLVIKSDHHTLRAIGV